MTILKKSLICIFIFSLLHVPLSAQEAQEAPEPAPAVQLDFSEQCNNFLRHYCISGTHEEAVNRTLLTLKQKGTNITVKLIKRVARSTPSK